MLFKKKTKVPMIIVIKSDDLDKDTLKEIREQLAPAFPDNNVAIVCIAPGEEMYAITN